jgi:DNA-binding CsgD family transcriptional regulator
MMARLLVALIAVLTILANLWFSVRWPLAVGAGLAVALVGELVGRLGRGRPVPEAPPPSEPSAPPSRGYPLSPGELKVAVLIADGLTSYGVGVRLGIKRGTVDTHVQHIYNKLGIDSRAQLAIWLVQHGLISADATETNTTKHK